MNTSFHVADGHVVRTSGASRSGRHNPEIRPKKEWEIEYTSDPRDVPLSRPAVYLRWAIDNFPWTARELQHLGALWMESGDASRAAALLSVDEDRMIYLRNRARAEVVLAAKRLDWDERWQHEHRPAPKVKWVPLPPFSRRVL